MLELWPLDTGRAFMAAQRACLAALEGRATADKARAAFIKAADEADVHIRSHEDPRKAAMRNPAKSQAWRKANKSALEAVEKSVTKIKAERERFFRKRRNSRNSHGSGLA
ncbi:DUF982 domain-containing protein [Rhizobium sp. TH2]|uniref:DUF982 domain-containing protein n=1 Tax=Rhizobium sp. TH2 TaxID=2775403 RepID=UPI002157CD73|nr:DUF982 domain-containing protein [Rhizobium sp. TH2]